MYHDISTNITKISSSISQIIICNDIQEIIVAHSNDDNADNNSNTNASNNDDTTTNDQHHHRKIRRTIVNPSMRIRKQ